VRRERATTQAVAIALAAVASTLPALAAPSTRLTYVRGAGADSCPDEGALRRAVEQRLGYDPFFPWADRTIVARIAGDARGVRGTVELLDKSGILRGSRELTAPSTQCGELISGMALAISIAIDPKSVDRAAAPANDEPAADPAVAEWTTARADEVERQTPPAAGQAHPASAEKRAPNDEGSFVPDLGAGVAVATGLAPGFGVGPTLAALIHLHAWSLGVEGRYLFMPGTRVGPALVSSTVVEGAFLGCFNAGAPFACAMASVGRVGISGSGLARSRDDSAAVARLGGRLGADVPLSTEWFLRGYLELSAALNRPVVDVDGHSFWGTSPLAGSLGVALHRRFP